MDDPAPPIVVGQDLPGNSKPFWQVEKLLTMGTCCRVYMAHPKDNINHKVALKVYKEGSLREGAFHREVILLKLLSDSHAHKHHHHSTHNSSTTPATQEETAQTDSHPCTCAKTQNQEEAKSSRVACSDCTNLQAAGVTKDRKRQTHHPHHHRHKSPLPHLVSVIDVFQYQGYHYLVNEYLKGDFKEILSRNGGGFSMYLLQTLSKQLLEGIEYLHHHGFVHGDLKPANLMWSPIEGVLKIIDFGLSFHKDDEHIGRLQTACYRAPECIAWERAADKSTLARPGPMADMWSIGCIISEFHTSERLFSSTEDVIQNKENLVHGRIVGNWGGQVRCVLLHRVLEQLLIWEPSRRSNAKCIQGESFFGLGSSPSYEDFVILPTCVVRLLNVMEDPGEKDGYEELGEDIKKECATYGEIEKFVIPPEISKVYIQYVYPQHAELALRGMGRKTFNGRSVLATYFPIRDFLNGKYY